MPRPLPVPRLPAIAVPVAALLLAGCAAAAEPVAPPTPSQVALSDLGHVHSVAFDPGGDALLLATHTGLVRLHDDGRVQAVGPVLDLMGFTVAAPDRWLASGHPGPASDLPEPLGLVESTDGGRSWQPVSRQGESDFHALAAGGDRVLGFDGVLRATEDGRTWQDLDVPAPPAGLVLDGTGDRALATTAAGTLLSEDGGVTWAPLPDAPLLQVVDWADTGGAVVGVDRAGQVWTGEPGPDGSWSWQEGGDLAAPPVAVDVDPEGATRIAAVTDAAVLVSTDGGVTFDPLLD